MKKAIEKQRAELAAAAPASASAATVQEAAYENSSKKSKGGILKLERLRNDQAPEPGVEFPQDDELAPPLLETVEQQNAVIREMIDREVQNAVRQARDLMATAPDRVEQDLKLELEKVMRAPELDADLRAQLRDQLESTIKEARRRATIHLEVERQAQAAISARNERQRLVQSFER